MTVFIRRAAKNEYGIKWELYDDSKQDAKTELLEGFSHVTITNVNYVAAWTDDEWREASK